MMLWQRSIATTSMLCPKLMSIPIAIQQAWTRAQNVISDVYNNCSNVDMHDICSLQYRNSGWLETRGNLRRFGSFIWKTGQAAQVCNLLTWYLVKTCSTPIANIYFIGRLVPPLQGSDILPENPGMEIYRIKTFANSVCYNWTTVTRTLQPK